MTNDTSTAAEGNHHVSENVPSGSSEVVSYFQNRIERLDTFLTARSFRADTLSIRTEDLDASEINSRGLERLNGILADLREGKTNEATRYLYEKMEPLALEHNKVGERLKGEYPDDKLYREGRLLLEETAKEKKELDEQKFPLHHEAMMHFEKEARSRLEATGRFRDERTRGDVDAKLGQLKELTEKLTSTGTST